MEIEENPLDAIEIFYEAQLLIATELLLNKVGLPNNIIKDMLNIMSKEEMQELLDLYA